MSENTKDPTIGPNLTVQPIRASAIEIPAFTTPYAAIALATMPDIAIWAIALEEGVNSNGWRVMPTEFDAVAATYSMGKQLRLNHEGKLTEKVIGKSDKGYNILGKEIESVTGVPLSSFGLKDSDINPNGHYVVAHFISTPEDPQVRTNILKGYVTGGSIGLQGNGYCDICNAPVIVTDDGFERTCDHINSIIDMINVDTKEWSIVPEPAYAHTVFYPTLTAAANSKMKGTEEPTPSPVGEVIKDTDKNITANPQTPAHPILPNTSSLREVTTQVILGSTMTDNTADAKKADADAEAKASKMDAAIATMANAIARMAEAEGKRAEAEAKKADAEAEAKKADADAAKKVADAEAAKACFPKGEASDKGGVVVAATPTNGFNFGPIFQPKLYANAASKFMIDEATRQRSRK
jgi:hypothetical protein